MLNLTLPAGAPHWLELRVAGEACRLQVRPLTTAIVDAANYAAAREIADLRARAADLAEMGAADPEQPDVEDLTVRKGLWNQAFLSALARLAVVGWDGVSVSDKDGAPLDFSADVAGAAMRIPEMGAAFEAAYLAPLAERSAEKNGSRPSPTGISAAGRNSAAIAAPATGSDATTPATPASAPPVPT